MLETTFRDNSSNKNLALFILISHETESLQPDLGISKRIKGKKLWANKHAILVETNHHTQNQFLIV